MICFFMAGCTLVKLKENVAESMASTVLVGQISVSPPESGLIVVAAYSIKVQARVLFMYFEALVTQVKHQARACALELISLI